MAITFSSKEELKAFLKAFKLVSDEHQAASEQKVAQKTAQRAKKSMKTGPKVKVAKPKSKETSLLARIDAVIQNFLDQNSAFTANDIYTVLAKQDQDINKMSVITSVLKRMNGPFSKILVSTRPGKGPRPEKLYNP